MQSKIFPCLWFDGKAKEAAEFYTSIFDHSRITTENPIVVMFEIEGQKIMGLNGGPQFSITPAISFFVTCATEEEIDLIWNKLSQEGSALMPLNKYPWSERYGWVKDKYGMTWQLMKGDLPAGGQKIAPAFLFTNDQYGRAEEAIHFYTELFPESSINTIERYKSDGSQPEGKLQFGQFSIKQLSMIAMDGPGSHAFKFNEALSIVVECENQEEIDYFWNHLTAGGAESMCGWLVDKYGVSWQIVPSILSKLMSDPEKGPRVIQAFLKMKKFDIDTLIKA